ncbi:MAG: T9SS type A sorting domain-containing protein [Candidatus Latescibacteria bacterium]|nr:T9SS type A sorting domain-containing protein [Candidatus Latescibacterota bacterium]NIM66489.1 T9SS type A sorting domain-containing protein [Candidatus Latescibacterota bacterium]NIO02969.1 T9SS type A sorting domain-containing protein [Candidatus Latescibacterota bacterium]NIO30104.1 T9SS type A sorting domain-containing protein [Candidatus Latescibacterota bacterium]NIO57723.1 T9SS type A sorting domain-containing protein [Candidatus Latescibacterota bacterium]
MKKRAFMFGMMIVIAVSIASAMAREASVGPNSGRAKMRLDNSTPLDMDYHSGVLVPRSAALADTLVLAYWTFDSGLVCDAQGWTTHDLTEQSGCYFHVDDFAGLGGGDYGNLVPLEGNQSVWCGARPDTASMILCGYAKLPGYGNAWDQGWCFKCIDVPDTEAIAISYLIAWDSEPGFDCTYLEYATKSTCDSLQNIDDILGDDWVNLATFDDVGGKQLRIGTIPAGHEGHVKIRFRFRSDAAWSDEDGLWDTDGAVIVDSITVRTALTVYDFEDFEDESPGDLITTDGDWECCIMSGFGDFAGLFPGITLVQEDPCKLNLTCMWAFVNGSTESYACGGFPAQLAVPKGNEQGQYINNAIRSPLVAITGTGSHFEFVFDVYRDLPIPSLIYYTWHIRSIVDDCPSHWKGRGFVYYGSHKDWATSVNWVGDLVAPGASHLQVQLGVIDMCPLWCSSSSPGECHSHSPLFDNVIIRRISTVGPQWSVRDIDLFNDTFPENGQAVGTGRVDAAIDITQYLDGSNVPGDSAIVMVSEPELGIGIDGYTGFGPAVYFYLCRDPRSKPMPLDKIVEDGFRWPVVDSVICDGRKWYVFRCDTVFSGRSGPRMGAVYDRFCIDVNDHFFTNGDTLWFFFGATDAGANTTYWSEGSGIGANINEACAAPMETQILPGAGPARGGTILYVDNFSGRGAQPFFDTALMESGIWEQVDRFDKRGPSSLAGNGLAGRVVNIGNQLHPFYRTIIWNSGDLAHGTVGDGSANETDDFAMLDFFLDQHPNTIGAGIYFSGDDMAEEWVELTGISSTQFIDKFIPHNLVTGDHTVNHDVSPLVAGTVGGIFDTYYWGVDSIVAYGGCPIINDFDMIEPLGGANLEMTYSGTNDPTDGAVVSYETTNALENPIGVVLSGFSYHCIRDNGLPLGVKDRIDHLRDILHFLRHTLPDVTGAGDTPHYTNDLAQNYPNPFNPSTTIKYSIRERAHVSLNVYNVAGQLVRTLVNEEKPAGEYTKGWNGRSDAGESVSSGVYFYRIVSKNFTQTKKMILLK